MNKNYKKLAVLIAVMLLTLSVASTGFAANTMANLKAYYRNIKIMRNGTQVQMATEPFIVDDVTYVPLRAISELLDKEVTFDGLNYRININDKAGQNVNELYNQILTQQQTISQLESKIKSLETKVKEEEKIISLKDLAKQLLKEYDEINRELEVVDLKLKGDEDDIDVEIYLDLDDDGLWVEWDSLTDSKIEKFLQNIVDDILDIKEYEDADIIGFIEDKDSGDELISFSIDKKGKVVLD